MVIAVACADLPLLIPLALHIMADQRPASGRLAGKRYCSYPYPDTHENGHDWPGDQRSALGKGILVDDH
jgi:hypothetical protein